MCGAECWAPKKVNQKHLARFEMWCWRKRERILWTDHVRSEEVLRRDKIKKKDERKVNWIGHIFRRNCLLKHVFEGKIGRRK